MPGRKRDSLIEKIFGSPDHRQIDGLGGADPLTSKVAIIGANAPAGYDLTYEFGQVGITEGGVDYKSLCGNITAAVGHFAVYEGLVAPTDISATVRVFNLNHQCELSIEIPVMDGLPQDCGDFVVPGVPGTGARITVNLAGTAGAATGATFPTGQRREPLESPFGSIQATIMDVGNPHVFVDARDLGLTGTETYSQLANTELLTKVESIRAAAAVRLGYSDKIQNATRDSPAVPLLAAVARPQPYVHGTNETSTSANQIDLVSRLFFMQRPHRAYAATSAACTGVASIVPGTVVQSARREHDHTADPVTTRIGHPLGVIQTESSIRVQSEVSIDVLRATVDRTARRIMDGNVYLKS